MLRLVPRLLLLGLATRWWSVADYTTTASSGTTLGTSTLS